MKFIEQSVELIWITPEPEKQIEVAGRTCYKSEDKITPESSAGFCKRLLDSGHHAMIELADAAFRITTDRGISHEIVRHRLASYAQESTRYCNYSKDKFDNGLTFITPPGLNQLQTLEWIGAISVAEEAYLNLIKMGCKPEIARSVLPTCLKTEIVMKANFREWIHFIKLRSSKAAHPQIRPIAVKICEELAKHAPSIFGELLKEVS